MNKFRRNFVVEKTWENRFEDEHRNKTKNVVDWVHHVRKMYKSKFFMFPIIRMCFLFCRFFLILQNDIWLITFGRFNHPFVFLSFFYIRQWHTKKNANGKKICGTIPNFISIISTQHLYQPVGICDLMSQKNEKRGKNPFFLVCFDSKSFGN